MIPCSDFIPAYSELFKYLHRRGGKAEVVSFWEHLAETYLTNLRDLVAEKGLRGCWEYWSHTLNEEAATFTMELDEEAEIFRFEIRRCPSMGRLNELEHLQPYPDYCEHCDVIYQHVLAPLGYEVTVDLSRCHEARCSFVVRPKHWRD
jgi:hypothetical protein